MPIFPKLIYKLIFFLYNSSVPMSAEIGEGSQFAYGGIGVVLHERCRIGRNVMISQQVTIGGRSGLFGVPVIEDDCFLGCGAKILGPIRIGANSVVGANAVVLHDVPPGAVVAGVPARIIRLNGRGKDQQAVRNAGQASPGAAARDSHGH